MSKTKLDIIENRLKAKNISQYEIFLIERKIFETIFLKKKAENEREIENSEYFLRILNQSENKTGIGIIKGNSMNLQNIDNTIENCLRASKTNASPKYYLPKKKSIPKISMVDKKVLNDPQGIKNDLYEELLSTINQQKNVLPTFGRFRIHAHNIFLRNSNQLNLETSKTFFFCELSLKAEKKNKLAEYWTSDYFKERKHLNFESRIKKWADLAVDNLTAELPKHNPKAVIIFPPHVLKIAINSVIGFHTLGFAHFEGVSAFNLENKVASGIFSLEDNGLLEGGLNTCPWDGEGNPHQKTELISQGIFKNRLYDQKYALLENAVSTGNGIRNDDGSVINSISNFSILPGEISKNEMISNIDEGYYIEKFSWLHPDPISGYFGAEIRNGYYIQNGEFKNPIKLGNVSGNVLQMINNCLYISKEREFAENSLFPYIAFENLHISS
ncbi:MAG: metallopeptidase TldD-related protein [Candidatus Hermodarchaeota archaeon]